MQEKQVPSAAVPVKKEHPAFKGMRSTFIGIVINGLLAIGKGVAGFFGNSYALVADAIESTSDVFSSLIVWMGLRISAKPPDKNHPYGHGKAEPIAAVIVSFFLMAAALLIVFQSVREIITPHHAPAEFTLLVLLLVVAIKETLFRFVFKVGMDLKSTAVKTDAWHHRSDAITSAFAFVGISIALIGGNGFESADDWAALLASFIISYNAFRLFRPAFAEIMDVAPGDDIEREVRGIAGNVRGVICLEKCFVRKMGFEHYVDLHVIVDGKMSVQQGHEIGHRVKEAVLSSNPRISNVLVHIEPAKKTMRSGTY
ncbi:MAG: cation diffusion facilitator family transporter [Nanoarchaeota archaeon]